MILKLVHLLMRLRLWFAGFRGRSVPTAHGPMHVIEYEDSGSLPPLVIVHGICAEGAEFFDTILRLRGNFSRIIVPDLPSHGRSSDPVGGLTPDTLRDTAIELLDAVVPEDALILGNSLGGVVTLRYCLVRPERVRALYLSSPAGAQVAPDSFESFRLTLKPRSWRDGVHFANLIHRADVWHAWLIGGGVRDLFARGPLAGFVDALGWEDLVTADEIRALSVPTRVVWGTEDTLLPRDQHRFFLEHVPEGTQVEEPDWGHCPYLDTPGAFADSILAWARSV
ncbi:MAG: alpha/beta hydrolase [Deltaproteobacteria bacterium]|nr:MAG: alpha/beta hydrolase [Deltaproteobacteria bacterium]